MFVFCSSCSLWMMVVDVGVWVWADVELGLDCLSG